MKSSLKIHLLTHTKVSAYLLRSITSHVFEKRSNICIFVLQEPPRSCDECGRAFIRQDCLLRHMRTKHREMLEEIMAEAEKKKLQAQLLAVAAASSNDEENDGNESSDSQTYLADDALTESIGQLLTLLVDETTLKSFGWPTSPVEKLLESVIRCEFCTAFLTRVGGLFYSNISSVMFSDVAVTHLPPQTIYLTRTVCERMPNCCSRSSSTIPL